ncbi:MAG: MBL fold metallo-hydrolase [Selenomonadaceae bacterium]|nr:MBL fold metallo-hydrolase [Selenomonadaceae bacterium]
MILQVEVCGAIATNAYFYIDDETDAGFLIDPGAEAERLLKIISARNFTIEKILLTHGHFDHIGAAAEIQRELKIPVCMQKNGRAYAENPTWNLSSAFGAEMVLRDVTYLDDNSEIILAANENFRLKIIPVAGHTTDGAAYYSERDGVAFVGDSIFLGSYGRTDFYGGDEQTLFAELKNKILTLPDETVLLSGHTPPTTVGDEKNRPWFNI